ncbi:hypothetical protein, partial [Salinispira pacifica]
MVMRKKAGPGAHVAALLFAAFLLSGAAAAQPAAAQQAAGSVAGVQENPKILPRVLVLFFRVPDQGFPPTVRFLAYESLVQELRSSMPDVVILEPARAGGDLADAQFPAPPPTPIERDRAARDMGGDSYLYVEMSGNVPQIDVRYEFADLLAAERSTSGSFHKVLDARFRNLNTVFWYSIAESIRDRLKSREQVVAVTFRGPAGTRVEQESGAKRQITLTAEAGSGQSQDAAQSPEGGRSPAAGLPAGSGRIRSATVQLPAPGAYRFRASLPGYYPAEAGVTV